MIVSNKEITGRRRRLRSRYGVFSSERFIKNSGMIMEKEKLRKKVRRNRRVAMMQNCIKVGICVVTALLIVTLGWKIAKPFVKTTGINADAQGETLIQVQAGTNNVEDGSGDVAKAALAEGQKPTSAVPGWQVDDKGWWYAPDGQSCYANGWLTIDDKQYHFGKDGYMDTGWTAIGGEGYYFTDEGVYDAEKDKSKIVAMTFDDGPGPYTNTLLDVLEQNDAKATFFMQGINVERYGADTIPRMAALGCSIGNHSYNHPNLKKGGAEVAQQQFDQTDALIAQYNNGVGASVIRFPFGEYTKEIAANTGRSCWFWDVDTLDWKTKNVDSNISAVLDNIQGGQIILMHDIHEASVVACQTIIPELKKQGYELVTVQELAASRGYEPEAGVTYFGFTDKNLENDTVTDKNRMDIG